MANRYVLRFSKDGYARYTSHLDLMRFFKRAFRKSGIMLKYSQGFNPHPKLGFAQPLSLGYGSECELLEFEIEGNYTTDEICEILSPIMPEGIHIQWCKALDNKMKSLAALCESAEYEVIIPFKIDLEKLSDISEGYMAQSEIIAMKRQKKDKKTVPVNIKEMIRNFESQADNDNVYLKLNLDCGSTSNCSPELVISSFCQFAEMNVPRYAIDVNRLSLSFYNNLQI